MSSHSSYDGRSVWPPLASSLDTADESPSHQQEAASASSASPASRRMLQRRRPGSSAKEAKLAKAAELKRRELAAAMAAALVAETEAKPAVKVRLTRSAAGGGLGMVVADDW